MIAGDGPLELDRHELLWVFEECGVEAWPFPLRPVHWEAETVQETALHRARTEDRLRARGLLEPAAARMLLAMGQVCADWTLAADLVLTALRGPRAAVVVTDRSRAWLLSSSEHAVAPVRLQPCDPAALVEALLALAGPGRPGRDGPWPVHPAAPADHPHTRRHAAAAGAAADLVATATGHGVVGAAARDPGRAPDVPWRGPRVVSWLDGPRGRYRLMPPRRGGGPAMLVPLNDTHLGVEVRTVLDEASSRGRSSA